MSYARWSEGDVYIYPHVNGYFVCMACSLVEPLVLTEEQKETWLGNMHELDKILNYTPKKKYTPPDTLPQDFTTTSRLDMIMHIEEHIEKGDNVPRRALERLQKEINLYGDDYNNPWDKE